MDTSPYIELRDVVFSRGNRRIFDGVSLDIPRGKITAIMGPSGTGKTTLLRLIGGQLKPDSGSIFVAGENVPQLKRKALYRLREKMGMLFQSGALFTDLSVFENVAFPLRVHTTLPEDMIRDIVLMKLEAVGLRGARDLMPAELSGGMTRRVALARSIALDPELIMYDEPFTGQDPIAMGVLVKLIRDLNSSMGLTSVLVSHDVPESLSICHYACIVADGRIIGDGTPEELRAHPSEQVQQFLRGHPDGPVPFLMHRRRVMRKRITFVGLDVHKKSISVSVAEGDLRGAARFLGNIPNTPDALTKLAGKLASKGSTLRFCYEAGPCGYGAWRHLTGLGHDCVVVAPSLIPRKPGDRVKNDRRDALGLAELDRMGALTPVWVPFRRSTPPVRACGSSAGLAPGTPEG